MSGVALGALAGVGFGLFQAVNRRVNAMVDVYRATFVLLSIGTTLLTVLSIVTGDVRLLADAPITSLAAFAAAGFVHFFLGWTFLGLSQQRLGAARTGALVGTTPLFGALGALVILGELLTIVRVAALIVVVTGAVAVALSRRTAGSETQASAGGVAFAFSTALCWSVSPLLIRVGLEGLPSPLLGVTVGIAITACAYGVAVLVFRRRTTPAPFPPTARRLVVLAGILVAVSIWWQWVAFDLAQVAVVLAVLQISAPVVAFVSPLMSTDPMERVGSRLWSGLALIVSGSVVLLLTG